MTRPIGKYGDKNYVYEAKSICLELENRIMRITSVLREDVELIVDEMKDDFKDLYGTTFLVTGAGGFLCSYFLDVVAFLNDCEFGQPCKIIAADNFLSGLPERIEHLNNRPDFNFINCDISKKQDLDISPDWIVHGASIASPIIYRRKPLETIDVNVNGTRNMLDLAKKGAKSMVYLSSSEIYGNPQTEFIPTKEDYLGNVSCTGPRACYDESKRLGETLCMVYSDIYDTPVKIVRPFNVYGPGQRLDDGRIIPDLMGAVLEGGPIVLYSDGRPSRAFCYVRDAIAAILYLLLSDENGEAFNVGVNKETSISELAECMADVAKPEKISIEYHISDDPQYLTDNPQRRCPDINKVLALGKWKPHVQLREGLLRTLSSYKEQAHK